MISNSSIPIHTEQQAPAPTNIEEAATLLGASITRINNELIYRTTPSPPTLHSSFSTINPVPCSELYVRLKSLTYVLEQHLTEGSSNATTDSTHLDCVVGIIPLLHKLLTISSSLSSKEVYLHSSHETLPTVHPLVTIVNSAVSGNSFSNSINQSATTTNHISGNTIKVPPVKITPPLASIPIRNAWVETLTLVHKLSPPHKLPSSNPTVLLSVYFEYAASHPKSSKSMGGVRVACLDLLGSIASDKILAPKYTRGILSDLVSLCNNGLKSSGAEDVMHRIACVNCLKNALLGWKDSTPPVGRTATLNQENIFISWNRLNANIISECIKVVKRASEDKFAEVRQTGARLAIALSSLLIPEGNSAHQTFSSSSRKEANSLIYLDEILAICLRNLDDESVGVSVTWSEAMARCVCTAVEYNASQRLSNGIVEDLGENKGNSGLNSTSSNNVITPPGKIDLASKLKAFNDSRKALAAIATAFCGDLQSAVRFIVQHFAKVGGEGAVRMGGSYSMGGRHVRVGLAHVLVILCKIQLKFGGISISSEKVCATPSDILSILMEMVGQVTVEDGDGTRHSHLVSSLSDLDDGIHDITLSPKRRNALSDKGSSMGSLLKNISGEPKHKSPFDATLARSATNRVLRRGMAENMPESFQLIILRDLISICKISETDETINRYNCHQVQVALIEISNLVTALGEACASSLGALVPALLLCLSDSDHGVRHEAAVAFQAVVVVFPSAGRKYIMQAIGEIQVHYDEVLALGATTRMMQSPIKNESHSSPSKARRGRPKPSVEASIFDQNIQKSLDHQYSIHGFSLLLSLILHALPKLPGALPSELLDIILAVADNLVSCQGNLKLVTNNPGALVLCVRSGYSLISAILSVGPSATNPNLLKIFDIWTRSSTLIDEVSNRLEPNQTVSCLEPFITSIVVFLQNSYQLLLSKPDILRKTTEILEKLFPVVSGYSQIDGNSSSSLSRLDSAKAAIMEAFLLLPSGLSPIIARSIFSFASRQIQVETRNGSVSTILTRLISKEDDVLDNRSTSRVSEVGQCHMIGVDEIYISLFSKCVGFSEREAVIHFKINHKTSGPYLPKISAIESDKENEPEILSSLWSSKCAKERVLNAAVFIFAASFQFQGSLQQISSITMLKDLMISKIGSGTEDRCAVNVVSTLLSCLKTFDKDKSKSLEIKENSSWMVEAASTFITLLPLPNGRVRRAAAEGLSLLACYSTSDGRNHLQSAILRSLENLMSIETDLSIQQKVPCPTSQSMFAGCLLTFGCIQRALKTTNNDYPEHRNINSDTKFGGTIPTMLMLTRLLPHIATHRADEESFFCRVFALQSFYLLLTHSSITDSPVVTASERAQILTKAVEIVESNFYSAWMTNSIDVDTNSIVAEKFAFEPTLSAVLIRLMSYLIPRLHILRSRDSNIAIRFSSMVSFMVDYSEYHPGVVTEAFEFFDCLSSHRELVTPNVMGALRVHQPPLALLSLSQNIFESYESPGCYNINTMQYMHSFSSLLLAARTFANLSIADVENVVRFVDKNYGIGYMLGLLNKAVGSLQYSLFMTNRGMSFDLANEYPCLIEYLRFVVDTLSLSKLKDPASTQTIILSCVSFLNIEKENDIEEEKTSGFLYVRKPSYRWQSRYNVSALLCSFLDSPMIPVDSFSSSIPSYVKGLLQTACNLSLSSSDQSELYLLQKVGIDMIYKLIDFSSKIDRMEQTEFFTDHISLILPSVKQALSGCIADDDDSFDKDGARVLYLSGCKCLMMMYRNRMINDVLSLKRILKMLLSFHEHYSYCSYPKIGDSKILSLQLKPTSFVDDRTSNLLPRVSSLYALSRIYITTLLDPCLEKTFLDMINQELSAGIAKPVLVMSAALAIDGLRLKHFFCAPNEFILKSGLTFQKLEEIDEMTKNTLIESCSFLSCFSLMLSTTFFVQNPSTSITNEEIRIWCKKTISVVQSEFFSLFGNVAGEDMNLPDVAESLVSLLETLRIIVKLSDRDLMATENVKRVSTNVFALLTSISKKCGAGHISPLTDILDPDLTLSNQSEYEGSIKFIPSLTDIRTIRQISQIVSQSCSFVEAVCGSSYTEELGSEFLLRNLLGPIVALEMCLTDSSSDDQLILTVLGSFIRGILSIVREPVGREHIIRALLPFSLRCYDKVSDCNDGVAQAFLDLIEFCFSCAAIPYEEKIFYIRDVAKNGQWRIWEQSVKENLLMITESISFVTIAIADHNNTDRHMDAVTVVSNMMQKYPLSIPIFASYTGPHVMEIFQLYGLNKLPVQHRTTVCVLCMKIVMLSYQYLTIPASAVSGKDVASYLKTVFQVLVGIVSFNGLPNKETFNSGSDPSLGRLCAQFFVHVIRTSPEVFKECMSELNKDIKLTLEAAVRADMAGYPNEKKKLNLLSFKNK